MKCFSKKLLFFIIICLTFGKVQAQSIGGFTSGAAIYCANANSGFINLDTTTSNGAIIRWDYSTDGGSNWLPLFNISPSVSYTNLPQSTCYRAIVKDGAFPEAASSTSCIDIYPPSIGGTITGGGVFCITPGTGTGVLTLVADTGSVLFWQDSIPGGTWNTISDTNHTLNHANLTQNTYYRAIVQSGATCPSDTSSIASFTYDSVSVAGMVSGTDTVCTGINSGTLNLTGELGDVQSWLSSTDSILWTPITNDTTFQTYSGLTQTTWYQAIVQNGACPSDTSTPAILSIIPNPISTIADTTVVQGTSLSLMGTGNGTAVWTPATGLDTATIFNPLATPLVTTQYTITVTDNNSCVTTDSVLITIFVLEFNGMVSNLFTPNGDGINDTWYIQDILSYPDNEVFIYNIYGNQVYTKKGYTNDWSGTYNGSDLPDGTYFYVLRFDETDIVVKGSLEILKNK
ncbi:MAG: gliding motility-associated C-terminal domain-containing protein [Bacteroidota bacterium]